jgi:catecholate siderophore receptor
MGSDLSSPDALKRALRNSIRLSLGTTTLIAGLAHAAEPAQLPRVRVEADEAPAYKESASPKATAPLADTPQTIAIIPQEIFHQQGAQNLTEVLRNTPGITFNAGENGFSTGLSNFSMRGFDTSGSIFIDGVRDSGNYNRDVFNLEQVEVVKGPAADNGRGSAGGYVNMVTKTPHLDATQDFTLSVGFDEQDSDERMRATMDINQPFGEHAALRVNALWQDGGVAGRKVAEQGSWGIAPSLAFGLGTENRVVLAFQHVEQDDIPDWGVPAAFIDDMQRHDPTLDAESLRDNFYGLASDFDDVTADSAFVRYEHDFSPTLTLSNQTRWSQTERDAQYTLPTGYDAAARTVTTQRQGYWRENRTLSNLTNLSANFTTGGVQHQLAAGLELSREESRARSFPTETNPGTGAPVSVFNPDPRRAGRWNITPSQRSEVEIETIAAYVYDTLELSEQWQLNGGLRVERYNVEIDNVSAAGTPQGPDGYDVSKTTVGGKLGVVFKPVQNGSLYAAVGVSSLPPGSFLSNSDISRDGDNAFPGWSAGLNSENAKVQRSINYELGAKWEFFDRQLLTTAALFRTERENVAITGRDPRVTPLPPTALMGYGEQVIQGIEFGVTGSISPAWQVFGGVVLMDSERKHSALLDEARRLANPADYGTALRTSGDELAFTPEVTANVWTTYRLPIGLTLGGGVRYVGSSWLGRPDDAERIIANGLFGKLPSYVVVDAIVTYDFTESVSVRLNVQNLTDELYAVSTNWPGQRVLLGAPRSFLLSADVRF